MSIVGQLRATKRGLTAEELSKVLGVHKLTIYRLAERRVIPCYRIGTCLRFDPSRVAKWLQGNAPFEVEETDSSQPIDGRGPRVAKNWVKKAAESLAKAAIENAEDPKDREQFKRIMEEARMLTFIAEEEWAEVVYTAMGECEEDV